MTDLHKSKIGQQFLDSSRESLRSIAGSLENIAKEITLIRQLAELSLPQENTQRTAYVMLKERLATVTVSEPRPAFKGEED